MSVNVCKNIWVWIVIFTSCFLFFSLFPPTYLDVAYFTALAGKQFPTQFNQHSTCVFPYRFRWSPICHVPTTIMMETQSFVHISTLYCNCNRKFIKEQVYENEIGYEKIMQVGNAHIKMKYHKRTHRKNL